MSSLNAIDLPKVDGLTIELVAPQTLRLKGTLTRRETSKDLSGFFESLHRSAVSQKLREFSIDVTELTFVNSSSIRLFIDWAVWAKDEASHAYVLKFVTSRQITWQQTAFSALKSLMKEVVSVERI